GFGALLALAGRDVDFRARLHEAPCDHLADAARPARDHGYLAFDGKQILHGLPLRFCDACASRRPCAIRAEQTGKKEVRIMLHRAKWLFVAALIVLVRSAAAQDDSWTPPLKTDRGIDYRTGGVGREEREALVAATRGYTLHLIFAG